MSHVETIVLVYTCVYCAYSMCTAVLFAIESFMQNYSDIVCELFKLSNLIYHEIFTILNVLSLKPKAHIPTAESILPQCCLFYHGTKHLLDTSVSDLENV